MQHLPICLVQMPLCTMLSCQQDAGEMLGHARRWHTASLRHQETQDLQKHRATEQPRSDGLGHWSPLVTVRTRDLTCSSGYVEQLTQVPEHPSCMQKLWLQLATK